MKSKYRYPGYRPFLEEDHHIFFGRDQDKKNLIELIELEQVVVLYGKSGYGKSSLLNAAVIPNLRRFKKHEVFNIRLIDPDDKGKPEHGPLELVVRHIERTIEDLDFIKEKLDIPAELPSDFTAHLWYYFKIIQLSKREREAITLVFDQFEDLREFSDEQVDDFARALNVLLRLPTPKSVRELITKKLKEDPDFLSKEERREIFRKINLKVVFSLHHDRLDLLDHLKEFLPNIFKHTYELKALTEAQSLQALKKPAALEGDFNSPVFTYSEEAVQDILYGKKKKQGRKKLLIEPFQLQLLGQHAEEKIIAKKEKEDKKRTKVDAGPAIPIIHTFEVEPKDLGDPEKIYKKHYNRSIAGVPTRARRLVEKKLIIDGSRVPLPEVVIVKHHRVSKDTLEHLLDKRLLRSELNTTKGISYELSHDSLIPPIQEAARQRESRRLWYPMFGLIALLLTWGFCERNRAKVLESQLSNGVIINPLVTATVDPISGPAPLDVNFEYRITDAKNNVKVDSLRWVFGDGNSSILSSVVHRYEEVRTYNVVLLVYDNSGEERRETISITVTEPNDTTPPPVVVSPPILEMIADPTRGTDSLDVFFTYRIRQDSTLDFEVNNVLWDFDDGEFSALDSLTHSYTQAADYEVKLIVYDNKGLQLQNNLSIAVPFTEVVTTPSMQIGMTPTRGPAPLTVQFYLTDTIPQSQNEYVWKINGQEFSTVLNSDYTFQTQGTYTVKLEIKNNDGTIISLSRDILIDPPEEDESVVIDEPVVPLPVAVALPKKAEGIAPFQVEFKGDTSTPSDAKLTYNWEFNGESFSTLPNPSFIFETAKDKYDVILTVTDSLGRVSRDTVAILVKEDKPPVADAIASKYEGVAPFTVQFDGRNSTDDVGLVGYQWDFDDGITLDGAATAHTFIEEGIHNVRLTVLDSRGQSNSTGIRIMVLPHRIPDPPKDYRTWMERFVSVQNKNLDDIRDASNSWRKHVIPPDSLNLIAIHMDETTNSNIPENNELPDLFFFFTANEKDNDEVEVYKFRNDIKSDFPILRSERYSLQSIINISKRNFRRNKRSGRDTIPRKLMIPNGDVKFFSSEYYLNVADLFEKNRTNSKTINFYYTLFPYSYFDSAVQKEIDETYQLLGQPKE